MFSLPNLEHQLNVYYLGETDSTFAQPFDITTVPVVTREEALAEDRNKKLTTATPTLKAPTSATSTTAPSSATAAATTQKYAEKLQAIPEFAKFGGVLKSSAVVELTDSGAEYVVTAIKHIFKNHLVLQYDVKNTMADYALEELVVECTPEDDDSGLTNVFESKHDLLRPEETGVVYIAFERTESFVSTAFTNSLKFTTKDYDVATGEITEGGVEDVWNLDELTLTGADYILPLFAGDFNAIKDKLPSDDEHMAEETLQLSGAKSLNEAVDSLIKVLGMQALDGSDMCTSTSVHHLLLYGKSVSGGKVAAMVKMAFTARGGVTIKISAWAEDEGLAALVVNSVA